MQTIRCLPGYGRGAWDGRLACVGGWFHGVVFSPLVQLACRSLQPAWRNDSLSLGDRKLLRSIIGRGMTLAIKRKLLRSTR